MSDSLSLFSDENSSITVFFSSDNARSESCFVLFSSWGGKDLNSKVGGAEPLLRSGYDVISVQTNCDDWHQNIYPHGIKRLREYLRENYSSAKGYGSSMGGFGAILYADILNLDSVLALSPQYTISEKFDERWCSFDRKINWKYGMDSACGYGGIVYIVYDPFDLDAQHFELIYGNFKSAKVYGYDVKYGSHPVTSYFHDGGKLKELLLSFAEGEFSIPVVDPKLNKTYIVTLSVNLSKRNKLNFAKSTVLKAIEIGDERHSTYRIISNLCRRLNDFEGAVLYARKAVSAEGNNDASRSDHLEHLAKMLRLMGDLDSASEVIDTLLLCDVKRYSAYLEKASVLLGKKDVEGAKYTILRAIKLGDESHSVYRQASNVCCRLKDFEGAVLYAKKAVDAKDNNEGSRGNHLEHLAKMLRFAGELDAANEVVDALLLSDNMRYSCYLTKASILLDKQDVEGAMSAILRAIKLGDESHSVYRQASNVCCRLKDFEGAVLYAKKAVDAKDNNDASRRNHLKHLASILSELAS